MREIVCEIKNNYRQFHLRGRSARCSAGCPREGRAGSGARPASRGPDHPGRGRAHRAGPLLPGTPGGRRCCWRAAAAYRVPRLPTRSWQGTTNAPLVAANLGRAFPGSPLRGLPVIAHVSVETSPPPRGHPGPPGSKATCLHVSLAGRCSLPALGTILHGLVNISPSWSFSPAPRPLLPPARGSWDPAQAILLITALRAAPDLLCMQVEEGETSRIALLNLAARYDHLWTRT